MRLTYKPGKNPANPRLIEIFAGNQRVENCKVVKANNRQGKVTLQVEITDCEINRETEQYLYPEVYEESGSAEK